MSTSSTSRLVSTARALGALGTVLTGLGAAGAGLPVIAAVFAGTLAISGLKLASRRRPVAPLDPVES